jgi:Recombinase
VSEVGVNEIAVEDQVRSRSRIASAVMLISSLAWRKPGVGLVRRDAERQPTHSLDHGYGDGRGAAHDLQAHQGGSRCGERTEARRQPGQPACYWRQRPDCQPCDAQAKAQGRAADLAPVIEELRAAGAASLRQIAAGLNAKGITAARGGLWSREQVRRVLDAQRSWINVKGSSEAQAPPAPGSMAISIQRPGHSSR